MSTTRPEISSTLGSLDHVHSATKIANQVATTPTIVAIDEWHEMTPINKASNRPPGPTTPSPLMRDELARVFLDYSMRNRRRKPVRVEIANSRGG